MPNNKITTEVFEKESDVSQKLYESEEEIKTLKAEVFSESVEEDDWEEIKSRITKTS